tara:strand:+ start:226 stop:408 length:183 start_codon:yes stop_codon:yes gene_type:complete
MRTLCTMAVAGKNRELFSESLAISRIGVLIESLHCNKPLNFCKKNRRKLKLCPLLQQAAA